MLMLSYFLVGSCFPSLTSYRHITEKFIVDSSDYTKKNKNLISINWVCIINNGSFILC